MGRIAFRTVAAVLLVSAGCGDDDGPKLTTLIGHVNVVPSTVSFANLAQLVEPSGTDQEPNDAAATARFLQGLASGSVDAKSDALDCYRVVMQAAGSVTARIECISGSARVLLHDLTVGNVAPTLAVAEGAVLDLLVIANEGSCEYRVWLEPCGKPGAAEALPPRYCDFGEGFCADQIVAAPAPGVAPDAIARAAGLECLRGSTDLCLLRIPGDAGEHADFDRLCALLVTCAHLQADGWVRYAEPNFVRRLADLPNDPLLPTQWGLVQIRATAAWEIASGSSVVIAVVDSGVRSAHPDLAGRLLPGFDFLTLQPGAEDPSPGISHGTETAGIIAAGGNNGIGVTGIVWNGRIMPLRAFDETGQATSFDIAQAILFAAGLPNVSNVVPPEPAHVINLSFAAPSYSNAEQEACQRARQSGAFLAAAAGNDGLREVRYPAGYSSVVTVTATDDKGGPTPYSNYGPWVGLAAPGGTSSRGVRVPSASGSRFYYRYAVGTSYACAHVSGVAALVLGQADLSPAQLEHLLFATARGVEGVDERLGHGVLDAYHALLGALGRSVPALLPDEKVTVRLRHWPSLLLAGSLQTSQKDNLGWTFFNVPPGFYVIEAGTDRDFDNEIDDIGELYGTWVAANGADMITISTGVSTDIVPGTTSNGMDFGLFGVVTEAR